MLPILCFTCNVTIQGLVLYHVHISDFLGILEMTIPLGEHNTYGCICYISSSVYVLVLSFFKQYKQHPLCLNHSPPLSARRIYKAVEELVHRSSVKPGQGPMDQMEYKQERAAASHLRLIVPILIFRKFLFARVPV